MKQRNKLLELRETLGLNQQEIASEIGVSRTSVSAFEKGTCKTPEDLNKIARFVNDNAIQKHFIEGKCYRIYSSASTRATEKATFSGATWDYDCIFMFMRKEGIHHCFREIHGGWTRTYTDAQLVDKNIQEVSNDNSD